MQCSKYVQYSWSIYPMYIICTAHRPIIFHRPSCCCYCCCFDYSTYIFGEDEIGLEVAVSVLCLRDAVREGAVRLVPVDAHVAGSVVDQIVDVVAQLSCCTSTS
jgi:hypothetical protein